LLMPTFLDWHQKDSGLVQRLSRNGGFPIKIIEIIETDDEIYFLLDALDKEKIKQYHLGIGYPCGWIEEVTFLESYEE